LRGPSSFAGADPPRPVQTTKARVIAHPGLRQDCCDRCYFTPPAVRPATIRRWKNSTRMSSGMVVMTPAAMIEPYGVLKPMVPVN